MSDFKDVVHKTVAELFDMLKEKVAEVDSLKTQLNNMERCYIQIKKINDEQSEIIQGHFAARQEMQKRIDDALSICNTSSFPLITWIDRALRGEHETN